MSPKRNGKGADEPPRERFAKFEIQSWDHCDVRFLLDGAAPICQPPGQLTMIVNLAVADGYHPAVGVRHWLIDLIAQTTNGQPRRAQDRQLAVRLAGRIRAAVGEGPEHCLYAKMSGVWRP